MRVSFPSMPESAFIDGHAVLTSPTVELRVGWAASSKTPRAKQVKLDTFAGISVMLNLHVY
jgi:hypothetical protein